MEIGFNAPTTGALIEPDSLRRIITEGEALGFNYTTVSDHIMVPRNLDSKYPYSDTGEFPAGTAAAWLEQLTTTAYMAAITSKLRFVMSVMVVPHRPAVLTAKILATIDYLSKGRLTLGIGVGWCREEFEAIAAAPFDDRGHVTDEWMMACRELWSNDEPHFDGKYVKFSNVVFTPKPVQQPLPIWVGGESAPALRRTVRYADAWYPVGTNPHSPRRPGEIPPASRSHCACWSARPPVLAGRSMARARCSPVAPPITSATSRHWRNSVSARSTCVCSPPHSTARSTTCAASAMK
jgi:probable F420-dependent oxidoreductase